ncbi:MAG: hypothetical protein H0X30_36370, partial [Anaerolineae bacterium]|nr:hypothetical protein [Anaerolineae bacterium]
MMPPVEIIESAPEKSVLATGMMARVPPWSLVVFGIIAVQIGAAFAKSLFDASGTAGVV